MTTSSREDSLYTYSYVRNLFNLWICYVLVWRKRFDEVCDKSAKYEFGYLIYTLLEKFSKVSNFNLEVRLQSAVVTQSKFVGRILTHFFPTILNNCCHCNTITFVRCTIFQLENVTITFDDGVYTSAIN